MMMTRVWCMQFIMVFILADIKRTTYMGYVFPMIWELMGWSIPLLISLCIPVIAAIKIVNNRSTKLTEVRCASSYHCC